ncbi:UDP-glycosyltransferase 85A8 [Vitis vinifera]|uniref:UDP-glycosyltransferase 85A8 n=1 Tax=Vitis vinifera TaxID=29760 RepID=A0A438HFW8_VITVI|nr:UDP-glycosyltransferase 85A8 [Vitis vinifera]
MMNEQITCVIADITLERWPMEVAEKMGIEGVLFCPMGAGIWALALHIPKLIEAGIVNSTDGTPLKDELICVSKGIPVLSCNGLPWKWPIDLNRDPGHYAANFWPEDSTCIGWLDKQPAGSVIYGGHFLWVVRSDFTDGSAAEYPDGFIERVADHGKIVSWAPQEEVLAHPSVHVSFPIAVGTQPWTA